MAELILLISGSNRSPNELVNNSYYSPYINFNTSHYHTWATTESSHKLRSPFGEFEYWRPTNSRGFADEEWLLPHEQPNKKRILALGDSFTEGDGATFDSSYVAQLNRKMIASGDSAYFMNAGICGSDPFENYMNLEHLLLRYKPEFIIQCISSHDLYNDIAVKGGFSRFVKNGGQKYKEAPWWEPIYAISYVSRMVFWAMGYDELLIKDSPELDKELNKDLIDLFTRYVALCKLNNIVLIVVVMPSKEEVLDGKSWFNFTEMKTFLQSKEDVYVCDLTTHYNLEKDITGPEFKKYYWKLDGHHNGKGYNMMANGIYSCITPILAKYENK